MLGEQLRRRIEKLNKENRMLTNRASSARKERDRLRDFVISIKDDPETPTALQKKAQKVLNESFE